MMDLEGFEREWATIEKRTRASIRRAWRRRVLWPATGAALALGAVIVLAAILTLTPGS